MIRFEGAVKRYGSKTALSDLSLEIPGGALFALVGPNGAGKTTAIGLLTGLLSPTSGRTVLAGLDVARGTPRSLVTTTGRAGTLSEIFFDLAGGAPHP